MRICILRNKQCFGPYEFDIVKQYVEQGKILLSDQAYLYIEPNNIKTVRYFLNKIGKKIHIQHSGNILKQLHAIGGELIIPTDIIKAKNWKDDKRLLILSAAGLMPAFTSFLTIIQIPFLTFYIVALYFSIIWGLFFYYLFKTSQISIKSTVSIFFLTQIFIFLIWDILSITSWPIINNLYSFVDSDIFLLKLFSYIFGVGLLEEFAKAIPLIIILRRANQPLIPQSLVFYGLISGISFGVFEGVQYQMGVNAELDYHTSFFMNIARLTTLPFLHAIWSGISGYFLSFAFLYPKFRMSLYLLFLFIPALLHGVYDVFGWNIIGLSTTLISVILLTLYLKQGSNYQSKLSKQ